MMSVVELRQLQYFVAIAEVRSFTRAAEQIHVVQSALSASVKALETELEVRLLDRTTRRVELTDAGEALLIEARRTLDAADAARDAVAGTVAGTRGVLRVGVMHALVSPRVAAAFASLRSERPLVGLELRTDPAGAGGLVSALADGRLDAAVAMPPARGAAVPVLALSEEPMQLACPLSHPLATRECVFAWDLADEVFVDVPVGWGSRGAVDHWCVETGLTRRVEIEVGDVATVLRLVAAGLGVSIVAPSSAERPAEVGMVPLSPAPSFEVALLLPPHRRPKAAAVRLAQLLGLETHSGALPR